MVDFKKVLKADKIAKQIIEDYRDEVKREVGYRRIRNAVLSNQPNRQYTENEYFLEKFGEHLAGYYKEESTYLVSSLKNELRRMVDYEE